jgi:hypothetical protein
MELGPAISLGRHLHIAFIGSIASAAVVAISYTCKQYKVPNRRNTSIENMLSITKLNFDV